jgi:hypothetical protein
VVIGAADDVCAYVHMCYVLVLCAGLPFSPDFAVTHITQLSSRAGDEELRAGPTPWGTVLQLPASWAEAVASAELPDEQPLHTALEVCANVGSGLSEPGLVLETCLTA